ncbi:MAG: beta-ketoacyl synthase N-terminal-like domain-containing protein [Luteolibacter sp.]
MAANNFPLFIHGTGAVSAAGTDAAALYAACRSGAEIPVQSLERQLGEETISYAHRPVDAAMLKAAMPKHPRLRRASNVTKFAVTAAHEAMGEERIAKMHARELNVGIILTFLNGCVNYTNRFFAEVMEDPTFASPILFPETVFNAPASHIATYLGCDGPVYTLIGDPAAWFSAFDVAEGWISGGQVDGVLILCAEEIDWLTLEGLGMYSKGIVATEGAAAVYLEASPSNISVKELNGPYSYFDSAGREDALADAWGALGDAEILVDGLTGVGRLDRDELVVTGGWSGERISPAKVLGEGMGIRCGFQTVAAVGALQDGRGSVDIFASGGNQHAFSVKLTKQDL